MMTNPIRIRPSCRIFSDRLEDTRYGQTASSPDSQLRHKPRPPRRQSPCGLAAFGKWVLRHVLMLLVGFGVAGLAAAEPVTNAPLLYILKAGVYGFIDVAGKVLVEPKYEAIQFEFSEGLCGVQQTGKWGFVDGTGALKVPLLYEDVSAFSGGLARVKLDGKWGYVDGAGNLVIPAKYVRATSFAAGLARVVAKGDQEGEAIAEITCGFIDKTGRYVIKPKFAFARQFEDERAAVNVGGRWLMGTFTGGKWGFIDPTGRQVIEAQYEDVGDFSDGLAPVRLNKQWGYVDKDGRVLIPPQFKSQAAFEQGVAVVEKDGKAVLIDKTGKVIPTPQYDVIYPFEGNRAKVSLKARYGFIDRAGKEIVPPVYLEARPFSEGLAAVLHDKGRLWGYVDETGKMAIAPQFRIAFEFSNGRALVSVNKCPTNAAGVALWSGHLAYIKTDGEILFQDEGAAGIHGYKSSTGYVDGWALFCNNYAWNTPPGAGMVLADTTGQRRIVAWPQRGFGGVAGGVALEKAGDATVRLRIGKKIGYFNTATATVVWKPEE